MSAEDVAEVVNTRLVRVETKMDVLIQQGERLSLDHEARLRTLEADVSGLKVRATLVATGAGTGSGVLAAIIAQLVGA